MLKLAARKASTFYPLSRHFYSLNLQRNHSTVTSVACMAQLELGKAAIVRILPNEPSMTIQVQIGGKVRNLDRPQDELVEKPLMRLQKSACQNPKKKKKKNSVEAEVVQAEVPQVSIYMGPDESYPALDPGTTTNRDAWRQDYLLKIGQAAYSIIVNPPCVEKLHVHGTVFSGIPIIPHVDAVFTDFVEWQWEVRNQSNEWVSVSRGKHPAWIPSENDVGCMLRASCTPIQNRSKLIHDSREEYELRGFGSTLEIGPVHPAPPSASLGRVPNGHSWTTSPEFRVMTYNILADQYASTDTAKNEIFSHCPNEFLEWQYRRPLIFKEILDYKPDIACLQEVDASAFNLLLDPSLKEFGFEGVYTNKAGRVTEGSATFWRRDRFQLVDRLEMEMRQFFPKNSSQEEISQSPLGPALKPMLQSSPKLCEALQKVGTIAQLTLLVPHGPPSSWGLSRPLCVINTHLFYHYAAPHIRTIHVWAMLRQAEEFIERAMVDHEHALGGSRPSLLFCGDLNSDINDGIPGTVQLLRTGNVSEDYWDWKFGTDFAWGNAGRGQDEEESGELAKMVHSDVEGLSPVRQADSNLPIVPGVSLKSPFSLETVDGMIPEFTNFVKGYQGLLDYVWFQQDFIRVNGVAHCPTKMELGGYLPSEQYPSDHLAVVADLEFVEEQQQIAKTMLHPHGTHMEAAFRNVPFAEDALQREQVIAVPTDTIYGIAGLASSSKSIQEIYAIKRRDFEKPLAVCVADHEDISDICHVDHLPPNILKRLLPGPVTVVLDRKKGCPGLSDDLNPGIDALAVRIPDFPFLRAICRQVQTPLALTSANISGDQSPVRTDEMGGVAEQCALIFDHGFLGEQRSGSTIIDLRKPSAFSIIREGSAFEETVSILTQNGLVLEER